MPIYSGTHRRRLEHLTHHLVSLSMLFPSLYSTYRVSSNVESESWIAHSWISLSLPCRLENFGHRDPNVEFTHFICCFRCCRNSKYEKVLSMRSSIRRSVKWWRCFPSSLKWHWGCWVKHILLVGLKGLRVPELPHARPIIWSSPHDPYGSRVRLAGIQPIYEVPHPFWLGVIQLRQVVHVLIDLV